jgi:hypothetical protein
MTLSIQELEDLLLAVSVCYEQAKKQDTVMTACSMIRLSDKIKEEIKDLQFEEQYNSLPY